MTKSYLPNRFRLSIGGHSGPSYSVECKADGSLIYWRLDEKGREHEETVVPTNEQWQAFWQKIDRLELQRWLPHYENPGVCDGTGRSVEIERNGLSVKSSGDNNYPESPEEPSFEPEPTPLFKAYPRAVRSLLGRREFS